MFLLQNFMEQTIQEMKLADVNSKPRYLIHFLFGTSCEKGIPAHMKNKSLFESNRVLQRFWLTYQKAVLLPHPVLSTFFSTRNN